MKSIIFHTEVLLKRPSGYLILFVHNLNKPLALIDWNPFQSCFTLLCKGGWFSYQFRNKAWARNMFKIILLFSALLFLAEARPQSCKFCNIFLEKQTKYLNLTITIVLSIFSLSCLGCRSPGKGMSCRILCKRPKQVCSRNIRKWTRSLFFVNERWPSKMISHSFESLTNKQITNVDEQKNWRWSRFDSSIFMS